MKEMRRVMLICLVLGALVITAWGFSDLPDDHWAVREAKVMTQQGILRGYPDGSFRPNDTLSRAEFLAMCVRLTDGGAGVQEQSGPNWWKPYWNAAADWGLPFDETGVQEPVSRGEMAAVLFGGFSAESDGAAPLNLEKAFSGLKDVYFSVEEQTDMQRLAEYLAQWKNKDSELVQRGMEWSVKQGLLSGYPDLTFCPNQNLTRAEAVTVLNRVHLQKSLWKKQARIVVFKDEFCIYQTDNQEGTELVSARQGEDGSYKTLTTMVIPATAERWEELRQSLYRNSELGMQVLHADDSYFWGQCGFFRYDSGGTIQRITEQPVIDYDTDPEDNTFILVTHDEGTRPYLLVGNTYLPAGDRVMRCTQNGSMTVILDPWTLNTMVFPDGEKEVKLLRVLAVQSKAVRVEAAYSAGKNDLATYNLFVRDGDAILESEEETGFASWEDYIRSYGK